MTESQLRTQQILDALKKAVAETLDRKRRLGHYAIMAEHGRSVRVEPEDLNVLPKN